MLADKLTIGLFALHEFFVRFQKIVVRSTHDFDGYTYTEYARLGSILGIDQQRIFESFPADSLVDILQAWRILEGVLYAKGVSLSLKSKKYPYITIQAMLVLGGLDRLGALLDKPTLEQRVEELDSFSLEIWFGRTWRAPEALPTPPLPSIHHLTPPGKRISSADFPTGSSPTPILKFINCQDSCKVGLVAVILRTARTLDNLVLVDRYIRESVKEEGDPRFVLLRWNLPDPQS
jgi:hypothetical protein